ncbi:MAG: hypothetical protein ACFB0D_16250 [Phormidesmis sp.]
MNEQETSLSTAEQIELLKRFQAKFSHPARKVMLRAAVRTLEKREAEK